MIRIFFWVTILCFFPSAICFADALVLTDGRRFEGEIIEQNKIHVVIRDDRGRLNRFYNDQVAQVITDDPEVPLTSDPVQFENIDEEKAELILRLVDANGTRRNLQANIDSTIKKAPAGRQEELKKLFNINELIIELVPVYDRHFTKEDLVGMIEFYESAAGQKMLSVSSAFIMEVTQTSLGYIQKKLTPQ